MKNVERLTELRGILVSRPEQHDQEVFSDNWTSNPFEDCHTSCCAGGWTIAMMGMSLHELHMHPDYKDRSISSVAAEFLGLSDEEAEELFMNTLDKMDPEKAALDLIDQYIREGKDSA